jgi:tRNA pseudouridine38-40 synthase
LDTPRNIALLLSYDGSAYHGWQIQKNAVTVAAVLSGALQKVTGHPVTLHGCGRTDAGVHARHYVANFVSATRIPAERLPYAVNTHLPDDISVFAAADVPAGFHAINACVRKEYTYCLYTARHPDPLRRRRALFWPYPLDADALRRAAGDFIGTHDFAAFRSVGTPVQSTVRTVFSCDVSARGRTLQIAVSADGFLYNMVRAIAGTLLYVGEGKIAPDAVPALLRAGDRARAGPTAPPHGLYMTGVWYDTALPWPSAARRDQDCL